MDPLSLIVTAMMTGAALGVKSTAEQAVKDAYAGLKQLIIDRYGDQGDIAEAVEKVENRQEADWPRKMLQEELEGTSATEDDDVLKAARVLLEKADPQGAEAGDYEVSASDHSVAVGGSVGRDISITHTESDD